MLEIEDCLSANFKHMNQIDKFSLDVDCSTPVIRVKIGCWSHLLAIPTHKDWNTKLDIAKCLVLDVAGSMMFIVVLNNVTPDYAKEVIILSTTPNSDGTIITDFIVFTNTKDKLVAKLILQYSKDTEFTKSIFV